MNGADGLMNGCKELMNVGDESLRSERVALGECDGDIASYHPKI